MTLSPEGRTELLQIVRASLLQRLSGQIAAPSVPGNWELHQPAGCFVSLHDRISRRLRGCVGRLEATQPLWQAAWVTAGSALEDPRFVDRRVTLADVPALTVEVSVLSLLREAPAPSAFDPINEGIYLEFRGNGGCFLPQVARETGWGREQLLERLCTEKLGVEPDVWKHPEAKLFTFEVEIVGPESLEA